MVYQETFKIMDEFEKKSVPELKMTKKGYALFDKYRFESHQWAMVKHRLELNKEIHAQWMKDMEEWNAKCNASARQNIHMEEAYQGPCYSMIGPAPVRKQGYDISESDALTASTWVDLGDRYHPGMDKYLFNYYNYKPFHPWVMINISPKWKKEADIESFRLLDKIFSDYMKEEWFSEWYYCIETGGSGDHPHLHAVCKFNEHKNTKSIYTQISKSWKRQIMKYAKYAGLEGVVCKEGLQSILIHGENGEEILKDKLDYLVESKKPPGHKNKTLRTLNLYNARIHGGL